MNETQDESQKNTNEIDNEAAIGLMLDRLYSAGGHSSA